MVVALIVVAFVVAILARKASAPVVFVAAFVAFILSGVFQQAIANPKRLECFEGGPKWKVHLLTKWPPPVCTPAVKTSKK